jgi:hypothetical protein
MCIAVISTDSRGFGNGLSAFKTFKSSRTQEIRGPHGQANLCGVKEAATLRIRIDRTWYFRKRSSTTVL